MRMMTSDQDLARAAAGGDQDAFAVLLDRRYDSVFRLAFRLTGSKSDAEDLTQDICAALPAKLRGFKNQSQFSTWLYRVTVNAAHDQRRRAASHHRAKSGWGDWEINRRATQQENADRADWLTESMCRLTPDLRDTLALLLDQELTHKDAAEILNVSEGTISWRVSQAKKHLREMAQEEAGK